MNRNEALKKLLEEAEADPSKQAARVKVLAEAVGLFLDGTYGYDDLRDALILAARIGV